MPQMISIEKCEQIGYNTEDKVFKNIVTKLNDRHKSTTALSYFDQLSVDLTQSEGILQDSFPDAYSEIIDIMHEEYRALDELEQHCLFIYLFTNEKDEDEIVDSMSMHFEEWMEERAYEFLSNARTDNKLLN
jgi:hypothetical protein